MNALGRNIKPCEVVILRKDMYDCANDDRRFQAKGGYGLSGATIGSAIYGVFLVDGEEARIDGDDIDRAETEQFQAASV